MKNLKIRKMIIVLLVAVVVMSISTRVLATGLTDPTEGINITLDYPTDDKDDEGTPQPSTPSTPSTPTTPEPSTPNTPSQEQEKLPQTGDASDYAIFLLIGLFAVVSIYAYKKVKDYNRI